MTIFIQFVALALLSLPSVAADSKFRFIEKKMNKELWHYTQKLSANRSSKTFNQRIYINRRYAAAPDSPVFLKICGEQACSGYFSQLTESLAKEHKGFLVAIEHRFYGKSHPFTELTTEHLKHLNTANALNDLRYAIQDLRLELGLTGKLVAIGCSYPGNLAAYLRTQLPHLVDHAISVSAPVRAQTLLPEADQRNARVIAKECVPRLKKQLRRLESLILAMDSKDFQQLSLALHFTKPVSKPSMIDLLGDLPSNWASTGKFKVFCDRLSRDPNHLGPLLESFGRYIEFSNKNKKTFEAMQVTSVDEIGEHSNARQWFYQTCTEYGYFQITDEAQGLGPLTKNEAHKRRMCQTVFQKNLWPDTNQTNSKFFNPLKKQGSRILFVNSKNDYWTTLSVTPQNNKNSNITAKVFAEGGHCTALRDFPRGKAGPQAKVVQSFVREMLSSPASP